MAKVIAKAKAKVRTRPTRPRSEEDTPAAPRSAIARATALERRLAVVQECLTRCRSALAAARTVAHHESVKRRAREAELSCLRATSEATTCEIRELRAWKKAALAFGEFSMSEIRELSEWKEAALASARAAKNEISELRAWKECALAAVARSLESDESAESAESESYGDDSGSSSNVYLRR